MFSSEPVYRARLRKKQASGSDDIVSAHAAGRQFAAVRDVASAVKSAREIGYPVVLKPNEQWRGDLSMSICATTNWQKGRRWQPRSRRAARHVCRVSFPVRSLPLVVVGGKLFYAGIALRLRERVMAGTQSAAVPPRSKTAIPNVANDTLSPIVLDADSDRSPRPPGLVRRASIIAAGRVVRVKGASNVATGGTVVDVTHALHPDNLNAALPRGCSDRAGRNRRRLHHARHYEILA